MGVREPKPTEGEASGAGAGDLRGLHSNFLYLPPRRFRSCDITKGWINEPLLVTHMGNSAGLPQQTSGQRQLYF